MKAALNVKRNVEVYFNLQAIFGVLYIRMPLCAAEWMKTSSNIAESQYFHLVLIVFKTSVLQSRANTTKTFLTVQLHYGLHH